MSIIRVRKDARYFTASNEPFTDKRLSWETRGLIGYLLTKPDNWQVRIEDLQTQGPAKLHKIRRMLAEARLYGYMTRYRIAKPDGTFEWETEIFESPSQNPRPSKGVVKKTVAFTSVRKSTSGSSTSGKPADVLSTDSPNTETVPNGTPQRAKAQDIPEIALYRAVTNRYPSEEVWEEVKTAMRKIKARLGHRPTVDELKPFRVEWVARVGNGSSIKWLTEWAVAGRIPPPGVRTNGNHERQRANREALEAIKFDENGMMIDV